MSEIIDLGGAPANEDCAQLGHTPDFDRLNRLEVATYRAAIIARFGSPPEGCTLVAITNHHDFGVCRTLGLRIDAMPAQRDAVAGYIAAAENGLASWIEAGFAPPVRYDDGAAPTVDRDRLDDIVTGALIATRPDASGRFAIPDFERLHRNLASAFPRSAETAHALLQEIGA